MDEQKKPNKLDEWIDRNFWMLILMLVLFTLCMARTDLLTSRVGSLERFLQISQTGDVVSKTEQSKPKFPEADAWIQGHYRCEPDTATSADLVEQRSCPDGGSLVVQTDCVNGRFVNHTACRPK